MKQFNTTAVCIPSKHYMVDISGRVEEIKKLVDDGKYFTINRARQYGKTTTLQALADSISGRYSVISISFEGIGEAGFAEEAAFVREFCRLLRREFERVEGIPDRIRKMIDDLFERDPYKQKLGDLFDILLEWCKISEKKVVLMIDEVDTAANSQVFLDFLSQLRDGYINRDTKGIESFRSVILAGVTDIKHLRSRIREDSEHRVNSPWNIAADFDIDMSLSEDGIKGMLDDYEADHNTGMDTGVAAGLIRDYTNGYPFLVSRICQLIDTRVSKTLEPSESWSRKGIDEAVKMILADSSTLFQSLSSKLENYDRLKKSLRSVLMQGEKLAWNLYQEDIAQMKMYGFIRNDNNTVKIDNRIFETWLYNLFLSDEELQSNAFSKAGDLLRNQFVDNGELNMRLILRRFSETFTEIFGPLEDRFREKDGRELFLLYLKPIINGTGNYYIEAQTRDQTRTDVIVDYLGRQYIIELKIWRGERYNAEGEKQISEYLDYFGLSTGYMLSFNFNKNKITGLRRVESGGKVLFECTV